MTAWLLNPTPEIARLVDEDEPAILPLPFDASLPDLSAITSAAQLSALLRERHPAEPPETFRARVEKLWNPLSALSQEDMIAVPLETGELAIAEVTGHYAYDASRPACPHGIAVEWIEFVPPHKYGRQLAALYNFPCITEITDPTLRRFVLEQFPAPYNRFSGLSWILTAVTALSLIPMLRGLLGM